MTAHDDNLKLLAQLCFHQTSFQVMQHRFKLDAALHRAREMEPYRCGCCGTYHVKTITMTCMDQGERLFREVCPDEIGRHLENGWRVE